MRTFHTGGIFTADPSRQIRAKKTGFLSFNSNLQTRPHRTIYGSNIHFLERETTFTITDYKNDNIETLPADSSIFIKNNSFVKAGQLIAELPVKINKQRKHEKNITANHSGEFIPRKKFKYCLDFRRCVI